MANRCDYTIKVYGAEVNELLAFVLPAIRDNEGHFYIDLQQLFVDLTTNEHSWIGVNEPPSLGRRSVIFRGEAKYAPPLGFVYRLSLLYPFLRFDVHGTIEHDEYEGWQFKNGVGTLVYAAVDSIRSRVTIFSFREGVECHEEVYWSDAHYLMTFPDLSLLEGTCPADDDDVFDGGTEFPETYVPPDQGACVEIGNVALSEEEFRKWLLECELTRKRSIINAIARHPSLSEEDFVKAYVVHRGTLMAAGHRYLLGLFDVWVKEWLCRKAEMSDADTAAMALGWLRYVERRGER